MLRRIPAEEKANFSRDKAELYYQEYQQNYVDDSKTVATLAKEIADKNILLVAHGSSVAVYQDKIMNYVKKHNSIVMTVNFTDTLLPIDYVFCGNGRRYAKIDGKTKARVILTSNIKTSDERPYVVNYTSLMSVNPAISNNSGLMAFRLLMELGLKQVAIAGMDGYTTQMDGRQMTVQELDKTGSLDNQTINDLISKELTIINRTMKLEFITPTLYDVR